MKKSLVITLALVGAIILVIAGIGLGYALFTKSVPSTCEIVVPDSVSIYQDAAGTVPLTAIAWGKLNSNTFLQQTVYLKNNGVNAVTVTAAGINWVPGEQTAIVCIGPATVVPNNGSVVSMKLTLDCRGSTFTGALSWDESFTANAS